MPEEFDPTISEAYDAMTATGDPGLEPAAPPPSPTDSGAPADTAAATGEGAAQPEGEQPFRWENVPPELEPLAKQFQGDYTRKATELAEQRKAFEAQQQQLAGWSALQQLAHEDPAQAAALLQQYAAQLSRGVQAGAAETDPYDGAEPVTETERLLVEEVRALRSWRQEQEQIHQRQSLREQYAALEAEFGKIEAAVGRAIPFEERERIAAHCKQNGIHSVTAGYRDLHWDAEIGRARQSGRDEASTVVQAKAAAAGAPSALVSRPPSGAAPPANDRELISQLYDEMVAAG